jgi:Holliday junction resolvase
MKWSEKVVEILMKKGYLVINITGSSRNGVCDIVALRGGVTLYIECKEGKDVQSSLQRRFQSLVVSHGGYFILAEKEKENEFLKWIE